MSIEDFYRFYEKYAKKLSSKIGHKKQRDLDISLEYFAFIRFFYRKYRFKSVGNFALKKP